MHHFFRRAARTWVAAELAVAQPGEQRDRGYWQGGLVPSQS